MKTWFGSLLGGLAIGALVVGSGPLAQAQGKHPKMKFTAAQAETIALKKYPGKLAAKTALEDEEGKWQYSVTVRSGKTLREVMVNGLTGHIDTVEVTSAKEEAREKKADAARAKKVAPSGTGHGSKTHATGSAAKAH